MPKPSGEWLSDDIAHYALLGVDHVVSLLEPAEVSELKLEKELKLCESYGIRFTNFPIQDRGLPTEEKFTKMLHKLAGEFCAGSSIAIHCRAGIGRAGLTMSCLLICVGMSPQMAINFVSEARRVQIPDTKEQTDFIMSFCS